MSVVREMVLSRASGVRVFASIPAPADARSGFSRHLHALLAQGLVSLLLELGELSSDGRYEIAMELLPTLGTDIGI